MTTFDFIDTSHQAPSHQIPARRSPFAPFVEVWHAYRRRIEEHRIIVGLSRHDPHVLRDMGFEPDEIYDAVRNTWDEVPEQRRARNV